MAKRPRRSYSLESRVRRIILSDAGLAIPGSSSDDVARAIRSRHREYQRYKLELFASVVRRAISSLPPPGDASCSEDSASGAYRRRSSHDATSSSTTTTNSHSPPSPAYDVTKSLLRSCYSSQTSKRDPDADQQLEMELAVEKALMRPDAQGGHGGQKRVMFADLAGMESVIERLMLEVVVPLCHPELPLHLGVRPVSGILLHGPPGCGKTTLAQAIADETGVPFYPTSATELVSGVSGGSEENIRTLFNKAYGTAPSIVFIDEIDAIASKRDDMQRGMERRVVTQLMTCMDEFHQNIPSDADDMEDDSQSYEKKPGYVIVIGATNRPDAVDQALRRPGRFDREIYLGVPDENARKQILERLTRKLRLPPKGQFDLLKIAKATPGFVGVDLKALVDTAGSVAIKRFFNARKDKFLKEGNNLDYLKHPLDKHEVQRLSIIMDDFGYMMCVDFMVSKLTWMVIYVIFLSKKFGVNMQAGVLLFGPPGCGKTLIAKAVAHDAGANFIHIKGPEGLNKYVGESEAYIRRTFARARLNSPCILFFDEIDALTTKRGMEGAWVVERLLNQLLIELDGADQREGVYVIGATNRIDVIDDALLRPGRLGQKYFVLLPSANERHSILKALICSQRKPVSCTVDLDAFARREECNNLSGADLASLVDEAAKEALDESLELLENGALSISSLCSVASIELSHFEQALSKIKPSVSEQQRKHYEALSQKYSAM
ncbi:Cell division control protein 48-like protein C [Triticum urartu]|uniref:Cell division control protein 48-like protein C n=2 Tax=Triticum urartu TaxID=4572 RepID=M7ZAJ5_TRIUA|nr:Cell division control protein 48-like protein C [Triticum urartu]